MSGTPFADEPVAAEPENASTDPPAAESDSASAGKPPVAELPAEEPTAEAPAGAPESPKAEPEPAPAVPVALEGLNPQDAAKIVAVAAQHGVPVEEVAAYYREQVRQAAEQSAVEQAKAANEPLLRELWDAVNAGTMTEEMAGELYNRQVAADARVAAAEARAQEASAKSAQLERQATLDRIRAEFPAAPSPALEALAAKGATSNELRTLADTLHKMSVGSKDAAVARYNAAKAKTAATTSAHAPAGGGSAPVQGGPLDYADVEHLSFADLDYD